MDATTVALLAAALLGWSLVSARLGRANITAPMTFVAAGVVVHAVGWVDISAESPPVRGLAEATLLLLLFSDAARVDLPSLRKDAAFPVRLLAIGLPLTIAAGAVVAWWLFPDAQGWALVLVAACLAPTDAGLGAAIINDPGVPARIRRTLNVESGLNDGIAAPLVTFAIAAVAEEALHEHGLLGEVLREVARGTVVGVGIGLAAGFTLVHALARRWCGREAIPIGTLATAVLAYAAALAIEGNGFVAAFVAGLAFSRWLTHLERSADGEAVEPLELTELGGQLLSGVVWFLFGAAIVARSLDDADWRIVLYAVLSLTAIRMVPVAIALVGMRLELPTVGFVGWFGPRGMASVVFALLAVDDLGAASEPLLTVVGVTVLLSVVAHGVTARPLAGAYGRWAAARGGAHAANASVPPFRGRRWAAVPPSAR